jgi:hypothetical protein
MEALDAEYLHQAQVVVDHEIDRPLEVARHRRRSAEAACIGTDEAKVAREMRHPAIPRLAALRVAMDHQHRLGLAPRIREVVHEVMHVEIGSYAGDRHVMLQEKRNVVVPDSIRKQVGIGYVRHGRRRRAPHAGVVRILPAPS